MRPLRLMRFLAVTVGLLSGAAYLWAPLVGPTSSRLHFAAPTLQWSVLPLRITAASAANRSAPHRLPLRVEGSFLVSRRHPEPNQVALHLPTPTPIAAAARVAVKRPPRVAHIPGSRPTIAPAATALPTVPEPAVPEPGVRPVTPTPSVPIPLPPALQPSTPALPGTPPVPVPGSPTPQPAVPATPPAAANAPPPIQPVVPSTPPATGPVPTPVSEPPPSPTPTPITTTPITTPPTPPPAPEAQTRPGRGCGDRNHVHTGPPGNPDATPC
jgi:hypothetical protein